MDVLEMWRLIYQEELPEDIGPIREILEQYSSIAPSEVDSHLYAIRSKAWAIARYPCIGRWRFLYIDPRQDPRYQQVLARLLPEDSRDVLLDLGCCVGQSVRQLAYDGVDGSRLLGTDLHQSFIDIGYELFKDRGRLRSSFVAGDLLNPADKKLRQLDGKVTIIHAANFWHLFNWAQQVAIAVRLIAFLKPGTKDAMVYGRHIGRTKAGEATSPRRSTTSYLHDKKSFQRLWDEVGSKTGTRWRVEVELLGEPLVKIPGFGSDSRAVRYAVYQVK